MERTSKVLLVDRFPSPLGELMLVVDNAAVCALDYADCETRMSRLLQRHYGPFQLRPMDNPQGFSDCIRAYLAGDLGALDAIPITTGGTPFQRQVWQALRAIPPGTMLSYGQLALSIGRATASRAVGTANALNPVSIIVPCHRLVGANGALTGYAGGLERKAWLLHHEHADLI